MWPEFDSKEALEAAVTDETLRSMWKEVDGKWIVPPPADDGLEELKSTLEKVRNEVKDADKARKKAEADLRAEKQRQKADDSGITEEKLAELVAQVRSDLESEYGNMTPEQLGERFPQFRKLVEDRDKALGAERNLRLDSAVKSIMAANGVRGDKVEAMFRLEAEHFDLTDDGKPKLTKHPGKALDLFVKDDLKKKYPEWFEGTKAAGGGAGGGFDGAHLGGGTGKATADEVLSNPVEALNAARSAGAAAK